MLETNVVIMSSIFFLLQPTGIPFLYTIFMLYSSVIPDDIDWRLYQSPNMTKKRRQISECKDRSHLETLLMTTFKTIARNKKANREYTLHDTYEAGIVLLGTEVKSIRNGKVSLGEGWIELTADQQAILHQVHISLYAQGNINNHDPLRSRKLLLNRKQITKLQKEVNSKGCTLIPLKLYLKDSLIKLEIALAKGKKLYDKRQSEKKKSDEKNIQQAFKEKQRK